MTNIAYQDIQGGCIHVYTKNKHLPKWERLKKARKELESMAQIKIFLYKKGRLIKLSTIQWEHNQQWT
jgi:hypothetical protein